MNLYSVRLYGTKATVTAKFTRLYCHTLLGQDITKHTDECLKVIEESIWDIKCSDNKINDTELYE